MDAETAWPRTAIWWVVASGLSGFAVGQLLGVGARQQMFLAVLGAGVYGLAAVWRSGRRFAARFGEYGEVREGRTAERRAPDIAESRDDADAVAELMATEAVLSPDKAREWLDQFLRRQQS